MFLWPVDDHGKVVDSKCFVTLMYQFLLGAIDSFTLKHAKLAKTNQGPFGAVYIAGRGLYQHAVRRQENAPLVAFYKATCAMMFQKMDRGKLAQ